MCAMKREEYAVARHLPTTSRSLFVFIVATLSWSLSLTGGLISALILVFLIIVLLFLRLDEIPFDLSLDGVFKASVMVASSVVPNAWVPPELVDTEGPEDGDRVVDLVVVTNPCANTSPHGFPGGISSEEANLWCLATYKIVEVRYFLFARMTYQEWGDSRGS